MECKGSRTGLPGRVCRLAEGRLFVVGAWLLGVLLVPPFHAGLAPLQSCCPLAGQHVCLAGVNSAPPAVQCQVVSRSRLQLLGMGALYVASKYEETLVPAVGELAYVADGAYRAPEVLHMERAILRALDWRLGRPLPLHFLHRNSKATQVDVVQHSMAKYVLELCLLYYPMAWVKPSEQAAAALCLAIHLCGQGHRVSTLLVQLDAPAKTYLGLDRLHKLGCHHGPLRRYSEEALQPTIKKMAAILAEAPRAKNRVPPLLLLPLFWGGVLLLRARKSPAAVQ
ncbi:hypothetical protein HPB48_026921 [Haemaphysalis longicornis]|uniref:Uncharacterized protein n=1 Tax=Haemaphysalis longicornis TaxID=44386 RepID=A0A9J6HAX3_HAELO|nr:hypothetical protein HPB48_026921 [Haemaphysalis longicornis]